MALKLRGLWLALLMSAIFLAGLAAPAAASEFSADMTLEVMGQKMDGKVFRKGDQMRQEMKMGGQGGPMGGNMVTLINLKTGDTKVLMPNLKSYFETKAPMQNPAASSLTSKENLPPGAKKVGTEKIQGYECDVYEFSHAEAGTVKVWLSEKLEFPLKSTSKGPQGASTMTLSNIKTGGVSDDTFQVPAGYKKMQMPSMPGGAGGPQGMGRQQ